MLIISAIHVVLLLFFEIAPGPQYTSTFLCFKTVGIGYTCWDWYITFPFDFHHGTHGTPMVSRIRDNWNEPSRNTTKRIVDQFQFFHVFQMKEHFWKLNEIYISQNYSYYAIHDFHSLTRKHLCHLVCHLWPMEKQLPGMLRNLWNTSTATSNSILTSS